MTELTVDADGFGIALSSILNRLGKTVENLVPSDVSRSLEVGEREWKKNARGVLSSSYSRGGWGKRRNAGLTKSGRKSRKVVWYGKTYRTGKYASSISHQMISSGGLTPEGEIGSPSMPGLAHLLEKGHGGPGPAGAHVHIAPAYDVAAKLFESLVERTVEKAINDA